MKLLSAARVLALALTCFVASASAQVPQLINYQGRVAVGNTNFEGTGLFKFALVNGEGTITFWSNDGTGVNGMEPAAAVSLPVSKGLYSVLLGDAALANMQAVPASVFGNADVRLRVWFNDGVNGFQLLTPDQRIAAVGYALVAASLQSNSPITASQLTVRSAPGFGIEHSAGDVRLSTYVYEVGAELGTITNHPLGFFTNNGDWQMTLYPNQNNSVGIGTSPTDTLTAKLQVAGRVKATAFEGDGSALTGITTTNPAFGQNTNQASAGVGREGTIGEIVLSAGIRANGIPCNGQLLPISQYEALFSLLGTLYGGDGITTFGIPDLRAAAPNGLTYSIITTGVFPTAP